MHGAVRCVPLHFSIPSLCVKLEETWRLLYLIKGKSVPLQARRCTEGSRKLRFPDYVTMAQDGDKVVSLTHWLLFTLRKYSCYSFVLEAESTPGP